jgi:hypothetical protein
VESKRLKFDFGRNRGRPTGRSVRRALTCFEGRGVSDGGREYCAPKRRQSQHLIVLAYILRDTAACLVQTPDINPENKDPE